jgi:hypothetical protein
MVLCKSEINTILITLSAERDAVGSVYSGVDIDLHEIIVQINNADRKKGNIFFSLNTSPKLNTRIAPFYTLSAILSAVCRTLSISS